MTMGHGSDHILGSKSGIAAEKYLFDAGLKRDLINLRPVRIIKDQPDIFLNPGKGVLLAHGDENFVTGDKYFFLKNGLLDSQEDRNFNRLFIICA